MKAIILVISTSLFFTHILFSQTNPKTSSKSAAQYDAASIDENIGDDKDIIYFSQLGIDRGTKAETKDIAREMLEDFTGLLYSMEQLAAAGGKGVRESGLNSTMQEAKSLNDRLNTARGFSFDTTWIGGVIRLHQLNLEGLNEQKATATNDRLKTAVTEAIPVLKRYIQRLSTMQKQLIRKDIQEKKEAAREAAMQEKERKRK